MIDIVIIACWITVEGPRCAMQKFAAEVSQERCKERAEMVADGVQSELTMRGLQVYQVRVACGADPAT